MIKDVTVNAVWTYDCQKKQDLDFDFINCSTRYWPDFSAKCEIIMMHNFNHFLKQYVESEVKPITLIESDIFYGDSEEEVKEMVKKWYNDNMVLAVQKCLELLKN